MTSTEKRHERNRALVKEWKLPSGSRCTVKRSNGTVLKTFTLGHAFLVDGCHAFIQVLGVPGNTKLSRVTPGWTRE